MKLLPLDYWSRERQKKKIGYFLGAVSVCAMILSVTIVALILGNSLGFEHAISALGFAVAGIFLGILGLFTRGRRTWAVVGLLGNLMVLGLETRLAYLLFLGIERGH